MKILIVLLVLLSSFYSLAQRETKQEGGKMEIKLKSAAFKEGEFIPKKCTKNPVGKHLCAETLPQMFFDNVFNEYSFK